MSIESRMHATPVFHFIYRALNFFPFNFDIFHLFWTQQDSAVGSLRIHPNLTFFSWSFDFFRWIFFWVPRPKQYPRNHTLSRNKWLIQQCLWHTWKPIDYLQPAIKFITVRWKKKINKKSNFGTFLKIEQREKSERNTSYFLLMLVEPTFLRIPCIQLVEWDRYAS